MKKNAVGLLLIGLLTSVLEGCSLDSLMPTATVQVSAPKNITVTSKPSMTFQEILQSHTNDLITGKVIANLPSGYQPLKSLRHYAFSTFDNRLVYLFDAPSGETSVVLISSTHLVEKTLHFPNFGLNHAYFTGKILYFDDGKQSAIKLNVVSGDYSVVSLQEMKQVIDSADSNALQPDETSVLQADGYVYTNRGTIFDTKLQQYLPQYQAPGSAYPHAELGDRNWLYAIDPRADGSLQLHGYPVKLGKIIGETSTVLRLDLSKGTPMDQCEYVLDAKGNLSVFAIGALVNGQAVVELFDIPLGTYRSESTDAAQ